MSDRQRIGLGWIVFHDHVEIRQHQEPRSLDARRYQQESLLVRSRKRLTVGTPDTVPLPLTEAHRPRVVGEQEIERCRNHHLIAPGVTGGPAVFLQVVRGGSNDVRHRIDDVATPVTVKIHGVFLESSWHELGGPESTCPGTDQVVGPDVPALEYFERRKKLFAEITLPAPDTGKGGGGPDHRAFADE